jgi:hypothetical protein
MRKNIGADHEISVALNHGVAGSLWRRVGDVNIETSCSPGAAEAVLRQEMPQLTQGATALRGRDFLGSQPVGLSERGINFLTQRAEERLGPCLDKAGNRIMGQGDTLFAVFGILPHVFCVIKWKPISNGSFGKLGCGKAVLRSLLARSW